MQNTVDSPIWTSHRCLSIGPQALKKSVVSHRIPCGSVPQLISLPKSLEKRRSRNLTTQIGLADPVVPISCRFKKHKRRKQLATIEITRKAASTETVQSIPLVRSTQTSRLDRFANRLFCHQEDSAGNQQEQTHQCDGLHRPEQRGHHQIS